MQSRHRTIMVVIPYAINIAIKDMRSVRIEVEESKNERKEQGES